MATWIVKHAVSDQTVGGHGTKKAATAEADEMTKAHEKIDAKHAGLPVSFVVVKVEDALPVEGGD